MIGIVGGILFLAASILLLGDEPMETFISCLFGFLGSFIFTTSIVNIV